MELKVPEKYKGYLISGFVVKTFDTYKPAVECGNTCTDEQNTINYNNAIPASKFISIEWFYITNPLTPSVYIPIEYETNSSTTLQSNVIEDIKFPEGYYLSGMGGLSFADGSVAGLMCYAARAVSQGNYWKASTTDVKSVPIGWGYKTSYWFTQYGMTSGTGQWVSSIKTTPNARNSTDSAGNYWNIIDMSLTTAVPQYLSIEYSGDPIYKKCILSADSSTISLCTTAKNNWCATHGSDDKNCISSAQNGIESFVLRAGNGSSSYPSSKIFNPIFSSSKIFNPLFVVILFILMIVLATTQFHVPLSRSEPPSSSILT